MADMVPSSEKTGELIVTSCYFLSAEKILKRKAFIFNFSSGLK